MSLDLTPIVNPLIQLAGLALAGAVGLLVQRAFQHAGFQLSQDKLQLIDQLANRAISAGVMASQDAINAKGWDHPDVHAQIVNRAVTYAASNFPGWLRDCGLDPSNPATADRLERVLTRILPLAIAPLAASPATPPVNAPESKS